MTARYAFAFLATLAMLALAGGASAPVYAQGDLDTPALSLGVSGMAKQTITVTAGPSGAPAGFSIWWMRKSDFLANNGQWWLYGDPRQGEASFTGTPTLNTGNGQYSTFVLAPNQSIEVEIGDLMDETGVSTNAWRPAWDGELEYGAEYVFCAFANASPTVYQSGYSDNLESATIPNANCTYTQGFWKTHPDDWPAGCLPMTLGGNSYTQAELLQILNQPVQGNGALSLAHQLIAVKLNICQGASDLAVAACRDAADALLAGCGANKLPPLGTCYLDPASTSSTTQCLDDWNNGITGPGHCPTSARRSTWGALKLLHR